MLPLRQLLWIIFLPITLILVCVMSVIILLPTWVFTGKPDETVLEFITEAFTFPRV